MTDFEKLAMHIAIEAPLKRGKYSMSATISWRTVEEVRAALDGTGIDWRTAHSHARQIVEARKRAAYRTHLALKAEDRS